MLFRSTGIIELPVLGGLTLGEADTIQELMLQEQSAFVHGAMIAEAISKKESLTNSEAFTLIEDAVRGVPAHDEQVELLRLRYAAEIADVAKVYSRAGKLNMVATVTAMIRHRKELPKWGPADTATFLQPLFDDIWKLAEEEMAAEGEEAAEPPSDELLGKPPEASGKGRKRTTPPSAGPC